MYLLKTLLVNMAILIVGCAAVQDLILRPTSRNTDSGRVEVRPKTRQGNYGLTIPDRPSVRSRIPLLRCPGVIFDHQDLRVALQQASQLYKEGQSVGYNEYPHNYGNDEGFEFPSREPYLVFPIKHAEAYSGGPPGHSRIIMSKEGLEFVGVISHRYLAYGEFKQCPVSERLLEAVNQLNW